MSRAATAATAIRLASATETGTRRQNEDDLRHGCGPAGHYAVLADGAGGHARGAEASRRAVQCVERALAQAEQPVQAAPPAQPEGKPHPPAFAPERLTQLVRQAHAEIQQHQDSVAIEARMHTTIVALWIEPSRRQALWTNVGDSRLYRVRKGRTELLSEDDSLVQQMVRAGLITPEQSRLHPQKNHLVAALGIDGAVQPHTVPRPVELHEGDAFLLASDGWWDALDAADIAAMLAGRADPQAWLAAMRARIVERAAARQDNFSAVAVWVGDPTEAGAGNGLDDTLPRAVPGPP